MFKLKENITNWVNKFVQIPIAGLDISDLTVKYLKFKSLDKIEIENFGEINIPAGIIEQGEIKKEKRFSEFLRENFGTKDHKLYTNFVAVSLPEEKSFVRVLQLPKIKKDELQNAIRWEIETNIPLPSEELIYDYEIVKTLKENTDHFDVVITAFPRSIVNSYVRALKAANLRPIILELESQAIVRAVIPDYNSPSAKIIIDMGRTRTSLILFAGAIIFTKTIEIGGSTIEKNISKTLGVDAQEAFEIKKKLGIHKNAYEGRLFASLIPVISVLSDEIKLIMDFYRNYTAHRHGASKEVESVLLCGGDANLLGLDTYLSSSLKVPSVLADPFINFKSKLRYSPPSIAKNQALGFTTVIGLAIRNIITNT